MPNKYADYMSETDQAELNNFVTFLEINQPYLLRWLKGYSRARKPTLNDCYCVSPSNDISLTECDANKN